MLITNFVWANSNDPKTKATADEKIAKENLVSNSSEKPKAEASKPLKEEESKPKQEEPTPTAQDSTNYNSVSKFNLIFYFIYKLKYDEDGSSQGYLEYDF